MVPRRRPDVYKRQLLAFHPDYATSQAGPPESVPSIADDDDTADTPEPMPVAA